MLCQKCNKNNATVHIKQNINGKVTEQYLCADCAREAGINDPFSVFSEDMFAPFTLFNQIAQPAAVPGAASEGRVCPACSMTLQRLLSEGRPGCDKCYEVFSDVFNESVRRIHGAAKHRGRTPTGGGGKKADGRRELSELESRLAAAIEKQEYEQAAVLRDKIKELREGLENA